MAKNDKAKVWICSFCATRAKTKERPAKCRTCGSEFKDVTELEETKL